MEDNYQNNKICFLVETFLHTCIPHLYKTINESVSDIFVLKDMYNHTCCIKMRGGGREGAGEKGMWQGVRCISNGKGRVWFGEYEGKWGYQGVTVRHQCPDVAFWRVHIMAKGVTITDICSVYCTVAYMCHFHLWGIQWFVFSKVLLANSEKFWMRSHGLTESSGSTWQSKGAGKTDIICYWYGDRKSDIYRWNLNLCVNRY